ncbi:MAG: CusA/CzcA family heavy metal efflux RND transporter [Saprospiraceae bacterium]|nr:CusA/CzcA family heavy metal efflux RND transporter [Saprospiraceae bacterium]
MFDRIMYFSIHNKLIIGLLVAALMGSGIYSLSHLALDAVPDITDNQVQIITSSPDLSAQEVERLITYPLEMEMGNIPQVDQIRSISRFGLSVITIVFKEKVDIYWAREQINQKIQKAKSQIPPAMGEPEMGPITTGLGEIYHYVIYPEDGYEDAFDAMELRSIQDWIIRRQLIGVPGVVEVNSSGGYLKQYEISINQRNLKAFGLSIHDVFDAVAENNANSGGSYIEREAQTFFIRGEGMVEEMDDLRNIVLKLRDGQPILLHHVAEVRLGHAPRFGAVTLNGKGEVVAGQVMMLKGGNAMEVTKAVKARIEEIKETLPEGIVLEPYLDRSKLINRTTFTVSKNLIEGALIVILILVLLLGNLRAGLIVASVIPLSMLFAVTLMRIFGVSANLMSLGAIDFGLIVDGAVIVVEAILFHMGVKQKNTTLSGKEAEHEVYKAASNIRTSATFGEIIILIVYLPIFFLRGVEGKMFIPMAQTVSFAILGALILSLTYVPMMSALFLKTVKNKQRSISDKIVDTLYRLYAPVRDLTLQWKYTVLAATFALFIFSIWILNRMGSEFIPTLEEGDFALHQILPPGSSIGKGVEISSPLQDILTSKFPEVEKVVTMIGTAEIPTDIMPLEAGDIYVILKPKKDWTSARTKEGMFAVMEEELNKFPGVIYEFTQPIQMQFNELMTGVRQDIAIRIYGEDLGLLIQIARRAESLLGTIPGADDMQVEPTAGLQQMVVDYDRKKIAKYGLSISHLNDILKASFAGKVAGNFYEGERRFDIVIRLREEERQNLQSLESLTVDLPGGGFVPMSELARISFEEGPTQISRDDTKRRITIGVNARNRDIASLISDIKKEFAENLDLPAGYYVRYGGQFENLERAKARLSVVVPLALLLIFLLLFFTFNSAKYALLIFTAIPLSAIGGVWALYLRGMPFSISAGVGFIALFGVAVLNGIVLIAYFNRLQGEGMTDIMALVKKGTKVRLRPVIMTASVASLGFLPMALSNSAGAEVQRPLATVVIGGLITATMLTLIILPILYTIMETMKTKRIQKAMPVLLILLLGYSADGQNITTLTESLQRFEQQEEHFTQSAAWQNKALDLRAEQPVQPAPFSVSIEREEFNLEGISGIQSLNLSKSFTPGRMKSSYRSYFEVRKIAVANDLELAMIQLKQSLAAIYIEASYHLTLLDLESERRSIYADFVRIATRKADVGESSRIPARQAQLEIEDIDILLEQISSQRNLQLGSLHAWLRDSTIDVTTLDLVSFDAGETNIDIHPHLKAIEIQQQEIAAQSEVVKAQSGPRPFLGGTLQSVDGNYLFLGYEVGIQIPLSGTYNRKQMEASSAESNALNEHWHWQKDQMDLQVRRLQENIAILRNRLDKIRVHLVEHEELSVDMRRAYQLGEISYVDMVLSFQSYFDLRKQELDLMKYSLDFSNELTHYSN